MAGFKPPTNYAQGLAGAAQGFMQGRQMAQQEQDRAYQRERIAKADERAVKADERADEAYKYQLGLRPMQEEAAQLGLENTRLGVQSNRRQLDQATAADAYQNAMREFVGSNGARFDGLVNYYNKHVPDGYQAHMARGDDGAYTLYSTREDTGQLDGEPMKLSAEQVTALAQKIGDPQGWLKMQADAQAATATKADERAYEKEKIGLQHKNKLAEIGAEATAKAKAEGAGLGVRGPDGKPMTLNNLDLLWRRTFNFPDENTLMNMELMGQEKEAAAIRQKMSANPLTDWVYRGYGVDIRPAMAQQPQAGQQGLGLPQAQPPGDQQSPVDWRQFLGGGQNQPTAKPQATQPKAAPPQATPQQRFDGFKTQQQIEAEKKALDPSVRGRRIEADISASKQEYRNNQDAMASKFGLGLRANQQERGAAYDEYASAMTRAANAVRQRIVPSKEDLELAYVLASNSPNSPLSVDNLAEIYQKYYGGGR